MSDRPLVLLVDDEDCVVAGLRRVLTRLAPELELELALSGEEALARVAGRPFTVVVSDLRMPGMSGLELLAALANRAPRAGRALLSGTAEAAAGTQALPVAHRFLCKPCTGAVLAATCRELHRHATSTPLDVGRIVALAIDEDSMAAARAAMAAGRERLARVVAAHPSLTAAVLHAVGSEFLGTRTEAVTLDEALRLLGPGGFERLLHSELLLVVAPRDAAAVATVAAAARTRAVAAAGAGAGPLDVVAALLADVDRLGSADPRTWTGLRPPGGAAALLGLWGIAAAIVERVAARGAGLRAV